MLLIVFQLGSDRYAIAARDIVEVLPMVALKEMPGAPRAVAGLMDYRGTAVPVIDLSELALQRPAARRVSTRLLMVTHSLPTGGHRLLALMAERATETITKDPSEFQSAGVQADGARYLGPVVTDARGLIQRVEIAALFNTELEAAFVAAGTPEPAT
jgi:chemotaxis-related protein WspB